MSVRVTRTARNRLDSIFRAAVFRQIRLPIHAIKLGGGRRDTLSLAGQTSFAEEFVRSQYCDDGFLALLRNDGDFHLALLDIET
jgi:hypothetical protein